MIHRDGRSIHVIIGSIAGGVRHEPRGQRTLKGMIVDITDRVVVEKEVIEQEKLRLLRSISEEVAHGIRNPLTSIGGFARRLRKRFPDLSEGDIILKESIRLENILKRIAEYLKPVEISLEECSINDLIMESVMEYEAGTPEPRPNILVELADSLPPVKTDRDILRGLFSNVLRETQQDARTGINEIRIRTFEKDNKYYIVFKSKFPERIPLDPDLFLLPFNSSRESRAGLSLSYRLLREAGGFLSYAQEGDERIFTVSIPVQGKQ